jgi:uncharacterized protein (TIGR02145 family)
MIMKKLFLLIVVSYALEANAQNYLISFTGTGLSTSVSTVKVENLTKGASLIISGSDVLRLTAATGVNYIEDKQSSQLKIYPNPMTDYSTLQILPNESGNAVISVLDMTGKQIAQIQSNLEKYPQEFQLSGVRKGFYLITVKSKNYQLSCKLVSNMKSNGTINIEKVNNTLKAVDEKEEETNIKGTFATVDMAYTTGDRLKFTGTSGNNSTVKMDIPASDKTITFNFVACTDGDNNNYPVIEIGTQVWMSENLKTTKYNDNTAVPLVTGTSAWNALSTPGYCWYNNDSNTNRDIYGGLYNWYVVNIASSGGRNICPVGWHVPSDAEWTTFTTFIGGESVAGKLKEIGTTHWISPNTGATDEVGFTARPGGRRFVAGNFTQIGSYGYWWNSQESSTPTTWTRFLTTWDNFLNKSTYFKQDGFSLRCLKN